MIYKFYHVEKREVNWYPFLINYWRELVEDDLHHWSFYDGSVMNEADFVDTANNPASEFFFAFHKDEMSRPVGHFHLTNFQGAVAQLHFSIIKEYHGPRISVPLAKQAVDWLFSLTFPAKSGMGDVGQDRKPYLSSLIGLTPCRNKMATRFIRSVGFKPIATLKEACYLYHEGRYSDGLLTIKENLDG